MLTVRTLPVKLSEEELKDRAKDLAKENSDKVQAELQKKDATAQLTATIKSCDTNISRLAKAINTGVEYREVECTWEYDFKKGVKTLKRNDTSEIVKRETITESERQVRIQAAQV
jgi:hypothetical protein